MKWVVFLITFIVFTTEALIHYHIGKNGTITIDMHLPSKLEMMHIIVVVLLFSWINSVLINNQRIQRFISNYLSFKTAPQT